MIFFTNFIPISMMVTIDVIKYIQGFVISNDINLQNFSVNSSNLNDELGTIDYIFTDKTGTLT
jgi:phospholipid-transporting ATPase